MPGGGAADQAAGQMQADAMRMGKAGERFLDRRDWLLLLAAAIPIIAIGVLAVFVF